ncbi:hypothetical protein H257_09901 [Aphanomyces astaci]|uniref:Uncharacterized protein n=1 Tax=Aphanomyces astaci TaxID=112090 RepID=W4G8B3_APHAT|nr:hypothetical protein H257_09901 [Aphanomyces astaci]ETV75942.1 hypothetical protein H257_09901 [Aphanomyces astaci]|eukprot:XP_009834584.1 hypothetical protein H257_09901 [Aphanomyces astaci]
MSKRLLGAPRPPRPSYRTDVRQLLDREFAGLPSSVVFDYINHTDRKVVEMAVYLNAIDDAAGAAFSSDSESESDADSCDDSNFADYEDYVVMLSDAGYIGGFSDASNL